MSLFFWVSNFVFNVINHVRQQQSYCFSFVDIIQIKKKQNYLFLTGKKKTSNRKSLQESTKWEKHKRKSKCPMARACLTVHYASYMIAFSVWMIVTDVYFCIINGSSCGSWLCGSRLERWSKKLGGWDCDFVWWARFLWDETFARQQKRNDSPIRSTVEYIYTLPRGAESSFKL